MPSYHYQALNAQQQTVRGELQADSVSQAVARLEAEGLNVQSIGPSASPPATAAVGEAPADLSVARADLESHLASVLARGKALVPALRAYAEEMPPGKRRQQFHTVLQVLDGGDVVAATKALTALPEYWIPLLSAATASRDPGRVLRKFLEESRRTLELRQQWWQALAYPLLVAGVAAVVLVLLSVLVVPTFRDIFLDFQLRLPPLTLWVIRIASWISSGEILITAGLLVGGGVLLVQAARWLPRSIRTWFGDRLGTPLGRANAIARFSQFLADLLEAGVSIPGALRIAGFSTRSARLQRVAWGLASQMDTESLVLPTQRPLLTSTVWHALTADLPTHSRIHLLREISDCHAERARTFLSWTRGLIEPLAICVIGALVGVVVLALFLPLFYLIHGLAS